MDAILFFLTAIAISTLILQSTGLEIASRPTAKDNDRLDARAILHVFLHASLGREITLHVDDEIHVQRDSEIAECLSIELVALESGRNVLDFEPLNLALLEVLGVVCNPIYEPYLVGLAIGDGPSKKILMLPSEPPESHSRYAASAELPSLYGGRFLVELVLVPAFLSEAV